jgi:hypothetical protein
MGLINEHGMYQVCFLTVNNSIIAYKNYCKLKSLKFLSKVIFILILYCYL